MGVLSPAVDFSGWWGKAIAFDRFVEESSEHTMLWKGLYAIARPPAWALDLAKRGPPVRFLVLLEDWCGDASNTIPMLARFADEAGIELRVLRRDEHPELMNRYLTQGTRSIPIVIVLDEKLREVSHWGPRPSELQEWVLANRGTMSKSELYPQVRRWYARDRGESMLRELLTALRS
jgi:hypothetical protein